MPGRGERAPTASEKMGATAQLVGQVLQGTYRIERMLGQGGMGAVYEASHVRLPRRFAVKVISPEIIENPESLARFQREAQVTSAIGHPHILEVIDFNTTPEGMPYILMEHLEGEHLAARIQRKGQLGMSRVASILRQASSALQAAHAKNVVHRDLKPENIFLCRRGERDDYVKVLDFGISKVLGGKTMMTRTHALVGTPCYMSPEQASQSNEAVDLRTDIHAMGVILFEMLTGRPPFAAKSLARVLYSVVHDPPPLVRTLRRDVPPALEAVIGKALQKKPEDRFESMLDFWKATAAALHISVKSDQEFTEDRGGEWADSSASSTSTGTGTGTGTGAEAAAEAPTLLGSDWSVGRDPSGVDLQPARRPDPPPGGRLIGAPGSGDLTGPVRIDTMARTMAKTRLASSEVERLMRPRRAPIVISGVVVVAALGAVAFFLLQGGKPDSPGGAENTAQRPLPTGQGSAGNPALRPVAHARPDAALVPDRSHGTRARDAGLAVVAKRDASALRKKPRRASDGGAEGRKVKRVKRADAGARREAKKKGDKKRGKEGGRGPIYDEDQDVF